MKVQLSMTVEVDPEVWNKEYNCGTTRYEIRRDIFNYVTTVLGSVEAPMTVEVSMRGVRR